MAYKVIILYQLYMPSYFLGTFTEYPNFDPVSGINHPPDFPFIFEVCKIKPVPVVLLSL